MWAQEASEALQDFFDTTDWNVLCKPHSNSINNNIDCIMDYINFCDENIFLVLLPKKATSGLKDFRAIALTSHVMKELHRTVLSPFLFILDTSDFQYNSATCR
ncbi:hypothetical protein L3Q82_021749, partial [Scortum barcoo]